MKTKDKLFSKIVLWLPALWCVVFPYFFIYHFFWPQWVGRLFSMFTSFLFLNILLGAGVYFFIPKPNSPSVFTYKSKTKQFFVLALACLIFLSVFIWIFVPLCTDVVQLLAGKPVLMDIKGVTSEVSTNRGLGFLGEGVSLVGDKNDYFYMYSFSVRMETGEAHEFLILKNSKYIVEIR